ncbi:MAG: DUF2200 family protein [Catenisphaera adipataccumulans]|uniref:DUF2200 family protein n=1 Tax=Catenisphaera adipataccumulans TaxID=700500 RepID=UPI003D9479FC
MDGLSAVSKGSKFLRLPAVHLPRLHGRRNRRAAGSDAVKGGRRAEPRGREVYRRHGRVQGRKGRTQDEVDELIHWLCGYDQTGIQRQLAADVTYQTFFDESPAWNPDSEKITGKICGVRIEDIEDPTMRRSVL